MRLQSFTCLVVLYIFISLANLVYYPKWQHEYTEATIGWDVSGYYMYLPAIFIYKDLKKCAFLEGILEKYKPTPDPQQVFWHSSGNRVMKYSIGQAVQYAPFFFVAHAYASMSPSYEADGFSHPYQFMISIGSLLIAFLGLYYLRKILLVYFSDGIVSLALLAVVMGSNYLNYAAIDGAMTHNNLFTIYAVLIYQTIRLYEKSVLKRFIFIGLLVGLAALTRPTEIISCMIPVLWGVHLLSWESINERLQFFQQYISSTLLAVVICLSVGFIQLLYWKYAADEWIVYSYQEYGFTWLNPHLFDGFFSYKSGWLVYSPMLTFALLGFIFLYKKKGLFWVCFCFSILFIYITFAWDVWWYGGSLGQRAMVQAYPILLFPLCSFFEWMKDRHTFFKALIGLILLVCCYLNLWFTHQAHRGKMLYVGQMTGAYYWKTLGRYEKKLEDLKLLDTEDYFEGERKEIKVIYDNDFEQLDSLFCTAPKNNKKALCLNKTDQLSPIFYSDIGADFDWLRASAVCEIRNKEWDSWRMTRFIVRFYNGEKTVKENMIRLQRHLHDNQYKELFFDIKKPQESFDKIGVQFWNADGDKEVFFHHLKVETYKE